MFNLFKARAARQQRRTVRYFVKINLLGKITAWKTTGRSWQPMTSAPRHLTATLEAGFEPLNRVSLANGSGDRVGEVPVSVTVSRQAQWKRRRKNVGTTRERGGKR